MRCDKYILVFLTFATVKIKLWQITMKLRKTFQKFIGTS